MREMPVHSPEGLLPQGNQGYQGYQGYHMSAYHMSNIHIRIISTDKERVVRVIREGYQKGLSEGYYGY